jgi:lipoprotein NlpI
MRFIGFIGLCLFCSPALADDVKDLLAKSDAALKEKKFSEAVRFASQAIEADPSNAAAYDLRGTANFKLGRIQESLADYDKQIELNPKTGPAHWRRGLTLYYAEKFAHGVSQFTTSDKEEPNDVENAIWHFLCNARVKGLEKARGEMLKVAKDPRGEYMMKIYEMFKGIAKPEDVFKSAEAGEVKDDVRHKQRFYANYYVSMYCEATGKPEQSLKYMKIAAQKYPIGDYMMDVANVHLKLREKK